MEIEQVKLLAAPLDLISGRQSRPPPDPVLVDGEEEYEVGAVSYYVCVW